jgi:hypothetical protein
VCPQQRQPGRHPWRRVARAHGDSLVPDTWHAK